MRYMYLQVVSEVTRKQSDVEIDGVLNSEGTAGTNNRTKLGELQAQTIVPN